MKKSLIFFIALSTFFGRSQAEFSVPSLKAAALAVTLGGGALFGYCCLNQPKWERIYNDDAQEPENYILRAQSGDDAVKTRFAPINVPDVKKGKDEFSDQYFLDTAQEAIKDMVARVDNLPQEYRRNGNWTHEQLSKLFPVTILEHAKLLEKEMRTMIHVIEMAVAHNMLSADILRDARELMPYAHAWDTALAHLAHNAHKKEFGFYITWNGATLHKEIADRVKVLDAAIDAVQLDRRPIKKYALKAYAYLAGKVGSAVHSLSGLTTRTAQSAGRTFVNIGSQGRAAMVKAALAVKYKLYVKLGWINPHIRSFCMNCNQEWYQGQAPCPCH